MRAAYSGPRRIGVDVQDRPDFAEFVSVRSPALLRTAYLLTGDWSLGEDLLQTALASTWRRWGRLTGEPEAYVRRTMLNTYLSWRRRRWSSEVPTGELPDRPLADGTSAADDRDLVWTALQRLPRRQRAVVVLRYYEDLTEAETANLLGITVGTVKSQASKALATLRVDSTLASSAPKTTATQTTMDEVR